VGGRNFFTYNNYQNNLGQKITSSLGSFVGRENTTK
jgi:hypothetical protein